MDAKVSRKEVRLQPDGPVEVLVSNIFDLYPIFGDDPRSGLDPSLIPKDEDGGDPGYRFKIVGGNLLLEWDDEAAAVPDAVLSGTGLIITAESVDGFYLHDKDLFIAEGLENYIVDIETLDDDRDELLDRAMFALVKQRGMDPVEPQDGIQWAEAVIGEVVAPAIIQQVHASVIEEGPGVRAVPGTVVSNGRENLVFKIELTNAV
jgi:hypothetical protein